MKRLLILVFMTLSIAWLQTRVLDDALGRNINLNLGVAPLYLVKLVEGFFALLFVTLILLVGLRLVMPVNHYQSSLALLIHISINSDALRYKPVCCSLGLTI